MVTRVKTCLSAVPESKKLGQRDYLAVAETVARTFMRRFHKLDVAAVDWIESQCKKETMLRLRALGHLTTDSLSRDLATDDAAPIPVMPMAIDTLTAPSSLLLPRASYLRDPYYHRKLRVPNPARQRLEEILEQGTFLAPGCGTVKVLTVVPVKVHSRGDDKILMHFAAVVRDWAGAFCLFFLEASADATTTTVYSAYPILSHVDFPPAGFTSIRLGLDDNTFILSFQNQDSANALHTSLKMAMASMYGQGADDSRIIRMRALSTEFAASDPAYYPPNTMRDVTTLMRMILSEERREGPAMEEEFVSLAALMRSTNSRDAALRQWVKSLQEATRVRRANPSVVGNHLRVIEVANMHPCPHDDVQLAANVLQQLSVLQQDQSEYLRKRIEAARVIYRLCLPIVDAAKWVGREETEDVAFDRCFEPVEGSDVALQIQSDAAEKKALFAARYTPPGIYLTVLCFCEGQVLATPQGTLISELISGAPSDDELDAFTAECPDFRWVMSIGGSNDNWAQELTAAEELTSADSIVSKARQFDVIGANTFRKRFVHAVSRLRSGSGLPSLGMLFDVPVKQRAVGCAHIVSVLRVPSTDIIPVGLGTWRDHRSLEADLYLHSLTALPSSRIEYLPAGPKNCVRFVKAAMDHRNSIDHRPTAGFYLGHIAVEFTTNGPLVLVPEANRHLPPMVLVSETLPTLAELRWIQSLNERKRRNQSFGLPATGVPKDYETFEESFSRAVEELEKAMDLPISLFYDFELFVLDEAQSMMGIFAVSVLTRYDQRKPKVPMCLVPSDTLEHQSMCCLWPRLYRAFNTDRVARQRRVRSELQVVASDELLRFRSDAAIAERYECDKFLQLFCWGRTIISWLRKDRRTLVVKCGGDSELVMSRGIEDVVVTAVSNYASTLDPNLMTMRERVMKAAVDPTFSYTSLLSHLREAERVMVAGYAQRPTPAAPTATAADKARLVSSRTHDDMYADEVDDDHPRPPTDYSLPCTLEELLFKDADEEEASKYFMMQSIVKEAVELACVDAVDVGVVKEVGSIINDMISVLEATDDLVDGAQLLSLQEEAEREALGEREEFQEKWLSAFLGADAATAAGASGGSIIRGPVEENTTALFYDGSSHFIHSFEDGVKICLAQASVSHHQLQQLLAVATSTVEALDLINAVQSYSTCLSRREALLGAAETGRAAAEAAEAAAGGFGMGGGGDDGFGGAPPLPLTEGGGTDPTRQANEVTLISKEFEEFTVPSGQPLRCLLLAGAAGKVRFPTVSSHALSVVANHLRVSDFNIPTSLRRLDLTTERAEAALDVAIQFKAPLLCLRLATVLFASQGNNEEYFTAPAVVQLQTLFSDGFFFEYPVRDWLQIETLGGEAVSAAMDVLWFIRFCKEALQEVAHHNNTFADHEGAWKQLFAETRVRAFLSSGVHAVTTEEVTLWSQSLGRLVEFLSFRENNKTSDAEVEVLAQVCPNLKSLDLSYTAVTERAVRSLVENCPRLVECSVIGTQLGSRDVDILRRHCAENKRKMDL